MTDAERYLYELHAQTRGFQLGVRQAGYLVHRGLDAIASPYASLSFGKDSTVMVHLLLQARPEIPVMYINCGKWDEWPDTARVRDEFLARWPCDFVELQGPSIVEAYHEVGLFVQDEVIEAKVRRAERAYVASLGNILDAEAHRRECGGAFIGVRKEESDNRSRLFTMRGPLYYAKTRGLWACHPLAFWSARDVWAYIVRYDLPYNELYDMAPEGREMARNGAMFGTRSARYGRLTFLRRMYPDWFNEFAAEFPEVRNYV